LEKLPKAVQLKVKGAMHNTLTGRNLKKAYKAFGCRIE